MSETPAIDAIESFFRETPLASDSELVLRLADRIESDPASVVATLRQAVIELKDDE